MNPGKRILPWFAVPALVLALALPTAAEPPPVPWIATDIGSPGARGSTDVDQNGVWTIRGSGAGISGIEDQLHFAYQHVKGDASIAARFLAMDTADPEWTKVGLMVRENETPGSPNVSFTMTPAHGLHATERPEQGDSTASFGEVGPTRQIEPGLYVRLQRVGNDIAGFYSRDGNIWIEAGFDPQTLAIAGDEALIGLAVTSSRDRSLAAGTFDQVQLQTSSLSVYGLRACGGDRAALLQWRPVKLAVAYNVYRGPAGATPGQWVKLNDQPVAGASFTDKSAGLVNGTPQMYAVEAVFPGADGKPVEGPRVAVSVTPMPVPAGLMGCSINEGPRPGSVTFDAGTGEITLRGSGDAAIGAVADQLYFAGQPVEGDVEITATALSQPALASLLTGAGITIRESLDAGARHADLGTSPVAGLLGLWRTTTNGPTDGAIAIDSGSLKLPIVLRLTRQGDTITPEYSVDAGQTFQSTGDSITFDPPLAKTVYVGLGITAGTRSQISEARFGNLEIKKL
jgi:hypothetical protein